MTKSQRNLYVIEVLLTITEREFYAKSQQIKDWNGKGKVYLIKRQFDYELTGDLNRATCFQKKSTAKSIAFYVSNCFSESSIRPTRIIEIAVIKKELGYAF